MPRLMSIIESQVAGPSGDGSHQQQMQHLTTLINTLRPHLFEQLQDSVNTDLSTVQNSVKEQWTNRMEKKIMKKDLEAGQSTIQLGKGSSMQMRPGSRRTSTNLNTIAEEDDKDSRDRWQARNKDEKPYARFKRIARAVMMQNRWTREVNDMNADEEQAKQMQVLEEGNAEVISFNPAQFKRSVNRQSVMQPREKLLFTKPHHLRTDADIREMQKFVASSEAFNKYPGSVQRELARRLQYESFRNGRIIIKQGDIGISLYFVMKGSVAIEVTTNDPTTGAVFRQIVSEVMAGGSFGEMALVQNTVRQATVICRGNSEFLRIDKEDFQEVLLSSYERETTKKVLVMMKCPVFAGWHTKELQSLSMTAEFAEFKPNSVIIHNLQQHTGSIHIVLKGVCHAILKVQVGCELLAPGRERLHMIPPQLPGQPKQKLSSRLRSRENLFLVIRTFGEGEFFGIGENLANTSVISAEDGKLEVLCIPTLEILRHGRGGCLEAVRTQELKKYPAPKQAFERYLVHRNWREFKSKLYGELMANKKAKRACASIFREPLAINLPTITGRTAGTGAAPSASRRASRLPKRKKGAAAGAVAVSPSPHGSRQGSLVDVPWGGSAKNGDSSNKARAWRRQRRTALIT